MDLVQIKIQKDDKTITYVKIIHEFDKTIPISEIKNLILMHMIGCIQRT